MFVLGHLGMGSWLAARRVRAGALIWFLLGALLPDLVDKPLYYAFVLAGGGRGENLGLVSGTRTFGHTLLFLLALYLVLPRRIGTALALGMATHLLLDEVGDVVGFLIPAVRTRTGGPNTISAILFPLLGPHFPVSPFSSLRAHAASLVTLYVLVSEAIGAALLFRQWRAGVFDTLRRRGNSGTA